MQIEFIHELETFRQMNLQWNRLLENSLSNVPFLRHEFQYVWWNSLGGGEWDQGDLWIAAGSEQAGDYLALAPLFRHRSPEGKSRLMFIGSTEISDYLDLIVSAENLSVFVEALFRTLASLPHSEWEQLDLQNVPQGSLSLAIIQDIAAGHGWGVEQVRLQPCPIVAFEGDWETYLGQLKKKQRHELRRKLRRVEADDRNIVCRILTTNDDLDRGITQFFDLMALDEKKATFLTSAMRAHLAEMIIQACDNGWMQLAFLDVDQVPAAGYLNFDYNNHIWIYNSGINPEFYSISPGWVLLGHIIQWAIGNNRAGIDFLRGDEVYKYRLGGVDRFIQRLIISR